MTFHSHIRVIAEIKQTHNCMSTRQNDHAAKQVDYRDDNTCNSIVFDEFTRTVHGAVKICFAFESEAALCRFFLVDGSGIKVCINGHALYRHCIKGEAGGDFSDAFGTLGDYDKLNKHQNYEHNYADHIIATDYEVAE